MSRSCAAGLLRGARRLYGVVDRMARNYRGDTTHKDLLMQLRRLAAWP